MNLLLNLKKVISLSDIEPENNIEAIMIDPLGSKHTSHFKEVLDL